MTADAKGSKCDNAMLLFLSQNPITILQADLQSSVLQTKLLLVQSGLS